MISACRQRCAVSLLPIPPEPVMFPSCEVILVFANSLHYCLLNAPCQPVCIHIHTDIVHYAEDLSCAYSGLYCSCWQQVLSTFSCSIRFISLRLWYALCQVDFSRGQSQFFSVCLHIDILQHLYMMQAECRADHEVCPLCSHNGHVVSWPCLRACAS